MSAGWIVEGRAAVAALAGVWLGLGVAAPVSAYIRIDEFTDMQSVALGGSASASDASIAPEALGGERDLLLERLSGTAEATASVDPGGTGLLFFENAVGGQSAVTIVWDGIDGDAETVDPSGLGNVDLTELGTEDSFAIRMLADQTADVTFQIFDATDPSGQTWSSGSIQVPGGSGFRWYTLPLLSLDEQGPNGAADPTDVGAILLRVSGPLGFDAQIDSVRVPEPHAWALGGAVLFALAGLRRVSP